MIRRYLTCALLGLVAVTGCAPAAPSSAPTSSQVDLLAMRREAGIPDCPATDLGVEQEAGGLPQTALQCLGGGESVNLADLPAGPTVVSVWAQWCGPCREESAFVAEASESMAGKVSFFGVNYNDPKEELAIEFAGLVGWEFPHVVDPEKSLQAPLGLPGIPMTLFVDTQGQIVYRETGQFSSTQELLDAIERHLGVS